MFRSDNQSVMNRIMLRFRPIAPKPVGVEVSSGAAAERGICAWGRDRRKYVRVYGRRRRGKQSSRLKVVEVENESPPPESSTVVDERSPENSTVATRTLQLLPERSEIDDRNNTDRRKLDDGEVATAAAKSGGGSVIGTLIIVECVTEWSSDHQLGLGFSDEEKIYGLEKDTCPGFISDGRNNVIWVNEAYERMVAAGKWVLVVRDVLSRFYPSFACRVSVIQQRGKGQKWNKIVPCDVWRMEFGGFAWKLDVNTALSLSL